MRNFQLVESKRDVQISGDFQYGRTICRKLAFNAGNA